MKEKQPKTSEAVAVLFGGGMGILIGAAMGGIIAVALDAFSNGMGWFVVAHGAIAMMLMGGWLSPCFVEHDDHAAPADALSPPHDPAEQT